MDRKKISLTKSEITALKSVLRLGEAPLEFIATAINLEIARREGRPRHGLRATQILVTPQHESLKGLEEIEIIASVRAEE